MWFTVLTEEFLDFKAGSIFVATKTPSNTVVANAYDLGRMEPDPKKAPIICRPAAARLMFTRPTRSLVDAMEESVNQCEANYC